MLSSVWENNELWYSAGNTNGIFKTDLQTGETKWVKSFSKYSLNSSRLFDIVVSTDEKLFFLPFLSSLLASYDKKTGDIDYIKLLDGENLYLRMSMGFVFHEDIVMIPSNKNTAIIIYNYKKEEIYLLKDFFKDIDKYIVYDDYIFAQGYHIHDDKLYVAVQGTWCLLQVDLKKKVSSIYEIDIKKAGNNGIFALTGKEDKLYIFEEYGGMVIWNIEEQKMESYKLFETEFEREYVGVQSAIVSKNFVWIFLEGTKKEADTILKYDCISGVVERINVKNLIYKEGAFDKRFYGYLFAQKIEGSIIALSINSNQLFYIDIERKEINSINLENRDRKYVDKLLKEKMLSEAFIENGIQLFCENILNTSSKQASMECFDTCGKQILTSIESLVNG